MAPFILPAIAVTSGLATAGVFGGVGKAKQAGLTSATAGQATKTAEPVVTLSEQAKRNRRLAASSLTKQFAEPTLGTPGLLGL